MTLDSACQKHLTQNPLDYQHQIRASPPPPPAELDHPLPDALKPKALALSLCYHWVNCSLKRWAQNPDISRPLFRVSLPSTSSHKTNNPYSLLWPGIASETNQQNKTPLNGFIVILNSFRDARVASHWTLMRLRSRAGARNKSEHCQNSSGNAKTSLGAGSL